MLSSDDGDIDVFYDSVDSLSSHDCALAKEEFGDERCGGCDYDEIWVNEPVSVKERRERFMQNMGITYTSSKVCSQEKIMSFDDSSISSADQVSEKLVLSSASEAEVLLDELKRRPQDEADASFQGKMTELCSTAQEFNDFDTRGKNWWKRFVSIWRVGEGKVRSKLNIGTHKTQSIKVKRNKKRWLEFSGLYIGQEIGAHKGLIWTMKFSSSGQYLASGGEDTVVRIWRVISLDTSGICSTTAEVSTTSYKVKHEKSSPWKKHSSQTLIFLPNNMFQIEESPLQEFSGHSCDILDLAWSNSDILLSSSMDKTVRLWQIGYNQCLSVFRHHDYVTCIQFNPVDENYFITGSIDGKVRIWGIRQERVTDWADIRDVISAISYKHDGKGFVVGSVTGTCRFYVASGKYFQLEAQIDIRGKKKASGNKITGIQFSQNNSQRIMITSEDAKIHIFDGIDLVQKYKGPPKSGSQMSGSFTSNEKHIISVGEDSRVYIWNFNDIGSAVSKQTKSEHSCEYFYSKGVTVAVPGPGMNADRRRYRNNYFSHHSSETKTKLEFASETRGSERFSLGNWFSIDGTCGGSMTWPEEKLPTWDLPIEEDEYDHPKQCHRDSSHDRRLSETWGQTIVAAGRDGTIKTFHNFGLPVRL